MRRATCGCPPRTRARRMAPPGTRRPGCRVSRSVGRMLAILPCLSRSALQCNRVIGAAPAGGDELQNARDGSQEDSPERWFALYSQERERAERLQAKVVELESARDQLQKFA